MSKVVDLDSRRPHRVGSVRCKACGYSGECIVVSAQVPPPYQCSRCLAMATVWSGGKRHVKWSYERGRWVERLFNLRTEWWFSNGVDEGDTVLGWTRLTVETRIGRGDATGSART